MRKLLAATVMVATFALPATADQCATLTIEDQTVTARTNVNGVQADLVGSYLNLVIGNFDGPADREGFTGESSVPVPAGATGASVCPDGSVSFTIAEVVTPTTVNEGVELLTTDEVAELRPEVREAYEIRNGFTVPV